MLAPGTQVDRYRIESVIGTGGMARVYRVQHGELGTTHALKVLMVNGERHQRRLLAEGRSQGKLQHPNLVAITDLIRIEDLPSLVLEYVNGPSLADVIDYFPRLSIPQVDELARQFLAGLAFAHEHGIVHRDLKPGNILLELRQDLVIAKVGDFGLAKYVDGAGTGTRTNISLGTPPYMAPEQIRDAKSVGMSADIYAAGAVLYEMLTGRRAFGQVDLIERFHASQAHDWVPVHELRPEAPARMIAAINAAMRFEPEGRPKDATALLEMWVGGARIPDDVIVWSDDQRWQLERLARSRRGDGTNPSTHVDEHGLTPRNEGTFEVFEIDEVPLEQMGRPRSPQEPPPQPQPKKGARSRMRSVLVGLLGLTLGLALSVALSLGVAALVLGVEGAEERATANVQAPETIDETPVTPPPPEAEPEPTPEDVPAPALEPTAPEPAEPVQRRRPANTRTARVGVSGISGAYLEGSDGERVELGWVPPGTYRLIVPFSPERPVAAMTLVLEEGQRVELTCIPGLRTCR